MNYKKYFEDFQNAICKGDVRDIAQSIAAFYLYCDEIFDYSHSSSEEIENLNIMKTNVIEFIIEKIDNEDLEFSDAIQDDVLYINRAILEHFNYNFIGSLIMNGVDHQELLEQYLNMFYLFLLNLGGNLYFVEVGEKWDKSISLISKNQLYVIEETLDRLLDILLSADEIYKGSYKTNDNPSISEELLKKMKVFDRTKYGKDIYEDAIIKYKTKNDKKYDYECALYDALIETGKFKDIQMDSEEFGRIRDSFKTWRSKQNKKVSSKLPKK